MTNILSFLTVICISLFGSCFVKDDVIPKTNVIATNPKTVDSSPITQESPAWQIKAWEHFVANGEYTMVNKMDFKIDVDRISNDYQKLDVESSIKHPYLVADLNHDSLSKDLAVIVRNANIKGSANLAVVVFLEPKDPNEIPEPEWIFQNKDLSRSVISQWSGGAMLRTYSEDGTSKACYINWRKEKKYFSCDSKYFP